jgi:hypothetical protein
MADAAPTRNLQRLASSALISAMISERDADPAERMEMRRKKETERRQQRIAEDRARAEQQKCDNRLRDGEHMFQQRWHETESQFQKDEQMRQLVLRSFDKLSRTIPRRDNPRVLIVSDHPWRQGFYVELLRMVGCQCDTTRSLSVGVTMAAPLIQRTPETSYDLIIVDRPRKAATDAEAAQMLLDFTYSVRVRDSVYRKEYLTTATNQFLFVLGATDFMPQFTVVQGASASAGIGTSTSDDRADIACIRRPLYFHLKKIRQLVLPPFVNTRLRFRLYRRDPNFAKIDRMFRPVTPTRNKDKSSSSLTGDESSPLKIQSSPKNGGHDEEGAKKKHFVTFESLQQENEDLHNVVISHIRNKSRLEDQIKELETVLKDVQDRFRYTIQGLEGQLRDKDALIVDVGDVARELKQKLHDAQIREMQLTSQLNQVQRRSKKKDLPVNGGDAPRSQDDLEATASRSVPAPLVVRIPVMMQSDAMPPSHGASPVGMNALNAALGQRLELLMQQQAEDSRRRKVMLDSVGEGFHDARVNKEAKLHAVEINSKPAQCDIWYQSPQEQADLMKFMASQYGSPAGAKAAKKPRSKNGAAKTSSSTVEASSPDAHSDSSRVQSRSQSRQQNSRGGATSRASSVTSAEDEFPMAPGMDFHSPFEMFHNATTVAGEGDDAAARNLRVENNALRKQLQFFKVQQHQQQRLSVDAVGASLNAMGGANALTSFSPIKTSVNMPSAEVLVADGQSDVKFLHRKIAALSQQVSVLESSIVQSRMAGSPAHRIASPHSTPPPAQDIGVTPPLLLSPALLAAGSLSGLMDADTLHPPLGPYAAITEAEVTSLRETISRLEYKVHSLDLSCITSTMQKLVYKSAMMRLLNGDGNATNNPPRRKAFTKDAAVNTTLEGVGAAAAMWDGGSLFSPKEMEQRINELGVKLKESHMMFKESQEQHLQSERKSLEMKLELEKMHNHTLELVDSLKTCSKKLATSEALLKESVERCTVFELQHAKLKGDIEEHERVIAELRVKPLTVPVGCQTKLTGDVTKKASGGGGGVAAAASKMLDVMKGHGHDGDLSLTPRRSAGSVGEREALNSGPLAVGTVHVAKKAASRVDDEHRHAMNSAGSELSSTMDFSMSMQLVMDGAPTNEEIDFLVTTRMAALALYSSAQVDGSDVPRKEHNEIVEKLQKDITDALQTVRKLNEVRNAQRTEVNEQRLMMKDMKEQKHSVPELREKIETLSQDLDEQIRNAAKRERLLRKEFDMLRLKYAHEDDNVAMAAFDIDAFAQHTLKTPLDMANDRSTKYVCRGVEHCLGVARRLLSTAQSRVNIVLNNVQSQTPPSFMPQPSQLPPSENETVDPRLRRRSVQIVDGAGGASSDASKLRAGRVGISFQQSTVKTGRSTSLMAEASAPTPVETAHVEIQTVFLPPYATEAAIQCTLQAEQQAALPPRRGTHARGSKLGAPAAPAPQRHSSTSRRYSTPDGRAGSPSYHMAAQSPPGASLRDVPNSTLPDDDPVPSASHRGTTPMQRSSLLHTPASQSASRQHHRHQHATPTDEDYVFGSQPSSAMFGSAGHYESVPLLETRCAEVQTDPPALDLPHVSGIVEWLEQVDEIQHLMFEASQLSLSGGGALLGSSTISASPIPLAPLSPSTASSATNADRTTPVMPLQSVPPVSLRSDSVPHALLPIGAGGPVQQQQVAVPLRTPLEHFAGGRSRRLSNVAISWLEPRRELVAAVRTALSSMIFASAEDVLQMSTATTATVSHSTPSPKAAKSSLKFTPTNHPGELSLRIPEHDALGGSSSLLPASLAASAAAATPRSVKSPFPGMFTPRGSVAPPPVLVTSSDTQTDPVEIRPAFSLFGGTFDQKVTTALPPLVGAALRAIELRPPHDDVGVQVELLMDPTSSDSSSSDDEDEVRGPLKALTEPKTTAAYGALNSDAIASLLKPKETSTSPSTRSPRVAPWADSPLPAVVAVPNEFVAAEPEHTSKSKRQSKSSRISVVPLLPVCLEASSQTESDANPSKLLTAVTAFNQSFLKLVSKLRVPLRLGNNDVSPPASQYPTVRAAVEWCLKHCHTVDLMIEKLSVAQRGLRNLGLHGVDLSIASLNVLVGDVGEDRTEQPPQVPQRHFGGSDGVGVSGSGVGTSALPPLLKAVGRHNPLMGSFPPPAAKKHESMNVEALRQANITMTSTEVIHGSLPAPLPPIRAVEDVYLSTNPAPASMTDARRVTPTAVDPGRASGSPATQLDSVVGVPLTPRDDPRKVQKTAAAAITVSTPLQPIRAPQQQRPVVHANKPLHVAVARNSTPSFVSGAARHSSTPTLASASTPLANGNGSMTSSVRSVGNDIGAMSIGLAIGDHEELLEDPQASVSGSPRILVGSGGTHPTRR